MTDGLLLALMLCSSEFDIRAGSFRDETRTGFAFRMDSLEGLLLSLLPFVLHLGTRLEGGAFRWFLSRGGSCLRRGLIVGSVARRVAVGPVLLGVVVGDRGRQCSLWVFQ